MDTSVLACEICGKPAAGVASSAFGAISHAYCHECVESAREVYGTLMAGLFGVPRSGASAFAQQIIIATCAFYGKTEDEFWAEKDKLERDYGAEP